MALGEQHNKKEQRREQNTKKTEGPLNSNKSTISITRSKEATSLLKVVVITILLETPIDLHPNIVL